MSEWTSERLNRMIADGVEENLSLDYKRADSLAKTDGKKVEVTKDVSSFANSSGGVLIYGIAEPTDKAKRHLPERIDAVRRTDISKEWLEQVIQTIQPRIEGLVIEPVTIDEQAGLVCYVVEIPQSHTAHQAGDHRYYKRHNFNVVPMEDYEVRDVMNRRTHPRLKAAIFVNRQTSRTEPEGTILVRLENVGSVLAHHFMVELELPIDLNGIIKVEAPVLFGEDQDGDYFIIRLSSGGINGPLFPGSYITLRRRIHTDANFVRYDGRPVRSRKYIKVSVFADEAPPVRAVLDIAPVVADWTPIGTKGVS